MMKIAVTVAMSFVLQCFCISSGEIATVSSGCSASAGKSMEEATVTCFIPENINQNALTLKVYHNSLHSNEAAAVGYCMWVDGNWTCIEIRGYKWGTLTKESLTLTIPNVTEGHTGNYTCTLNRQEIGHCTLEITVRLVNGTRYAGRLEIQSNGTWGTVCEDGFGREEVIVACNMLLPSSGKSVIAKSSLFGAGSDEKQILLDDLECNGTEMSLWECKHSGLYNHNCSHSKDVGIICDFILDANQLRLTGKHRINKNMGRVEIEVGGVWSGVCGSFSSSSAKVICTQLGFPSKEAMTTVVSPFGPGESTGFLEVNLNCTGNERHIQQCLRDPLLYSAHCNTEELGVICSNRTTSVYVVAASSTEYPFMEGVNISLKCENTQSDKPVANYSWPDTAGGTTFGQFLIFENVKREHHEKLVRCAGSYGDNKEQLIYSDNTMLEVYYEPVIEIISRSSRCIYQNYSYNVCLVTRGDNVTFTCNARSNPPPASFKWFGRKDIPTNTNNLTITAAEPASDDGPYLCYVQTTSDADDRRLPLSSAYRITVFVQYPPTVLSYLLNGVDNDTVTVSENSNVNMLCDATGMSSPHMRLMGSNRQELTRRPQGDILSYEKISTISFFLCKVQCEDSGDYRCEVDNELGHDTKTVKLLVPCAPRSKPFNIQYVDIWEKKQNFSVEIIGYPTPHLANIIYRGSTIKDRVDKPVESTEVYAACFANTFQPAMVVCNISVIHAVAGFYLAVFRNNLGDLPVDFVVVSNNDTDIITVSAVTPVKSILLTIIQTRLLPCARDVAKEDQT